MSPEPEDVEAYFRAVEETFIRLRGAPLLLSPADWKTAERWYEEGIPLELVERVLEELFERLRERDPERRIHSLRYCSRAVEAAWREVSDLTATAGRLEAEPLDVESRLRALAAALPDDRPEVAGFGPRITTLEGDAETVERQLEDLDRELVDLVARNLGEEERQRLERRVDAAFERIGQRVEGHERESLRRRLWRESVRRRAELPTLSLFSPQAEPDGDD